LITVHEEVKNLFIVVAANKKHFQPEKTANSHQNPVWCEESRQKNVEAAPHKKEVSKAWRSWAMHSALAR
jgi:hypothetical protein